MIVDFGFFDGSMVIFAFMKTRSPMVVAVSSPLQIRFICLRIWSGIGWPSAEPDTIDHSPCNLARSFLTASSSAAIRLALSLSSTCASSTRASSVEKIAHTPFS